ncbi:aminotransferase, class III [Biscogniauxia marginata]|nr:aminotransferase, class III [Biscogniauxia marginata]
MNTLWSSLGTGNNEKLAFESDDSMSDASLLSSSPPLSPVGSGNDPRPIVVGGKGNYLHLEDGREILDGCGGAAVACIGHGVKDVVDVIMSQALQISYVSWSFFDSQSRRELSRWLSDTSDGHFTKAYITCSGSEAMEGAMKLAHEYFVWKGEPQRINYISRDESYHGITLGSLALGGHLVRRGPFEPLLVPNVHRIPACNPYRQRLPGETNAKFVSRKAAELEQAFLELGPDTVAAFVAEPVVGAALGCAPAVPGYFKAMKAVCDKYGALIVFDEVMCGMGRTGTLHAWEQEGVLPDIQAVGKGLAGGYQPVSAILVSNKIVEAMEKKGTSFTHGHTYQDHPIGCATALKVQQIIQSENLLTNVWTQGRYLEKLLRNKLRHHPHVGDIRGRGLFWGIEFVKDRETKEPFDPKLQLSYRIHKTALSSPHDLALYYGQGCAGHKRGDHIMIMPAYNVSHDVVETIVDKFVAVVNEVFDKLAEEYGKDLVGLN